MPFLYTKKVLDLTSPYFRDIEKINIAKLSHKNIQVRSDATWSFWNLSVNTTNEDTLQAVGLLKDADVTVRQGASGILWSLSANTIYKDVIREAKGIVPLVELLEDTDTRVRQNASGTLWNLSVNTTSQSAIRKAKGISLLIKLLSDTDVIVRQNASGALGHLAQTNNKDAIREAQGIAPLVKLLTDPDTIVREYASTALWHLALNHSVNQAVIIDNGESLFVSFVRANRNKHFRFEDLQGYLDATKHIKKLIEIKYGQTRLFLNISESVRVERTEPASLNHDEKTLSTGLPRPWQTKY